MVNSPQKIDSDEIYCKGVATNDTDDDYENEFERVMEEQERDEMSHICDISSAECSQTLEVPVECDVNVHNSTATKSDPHTCNKSENDISRVDTNLKENDKSEEIISLTHTPMYPSELNPFGDDECDSKQTQGDQMGVVTKASKNPFGDSEEEEDVSQSVTEPPLVMKPTTLPKPAPRRSFSVKKILQAASLNPFWKDGVDPDEDREKNRLPVPLPRTGISKSMPSTPDHSPRLRLSQSFRQLGSGPVSGAGASAYYSMRRKKKPAPPPPNASPPSIVVSSVASPPKATEAAPSGNSSPRTLTRPRKARPAPPPPLLNSRT